MKLQNGFTIIEMMIVIGIISILTAVALPSYSNYVMRGRIPDATSVLSGRRIQAEQYFQDNRTYLDLVGPPAFINPACVVTIGTNFDFDCVPGSLTATTYTIRATGKGRMLGFIYTLDETATPRTLGVPPAPWLLPVGNCWVTTTGGMC